jgi:hypothetical protein
MKLGKDLGLAARNFVSLASRNKILGKNKIFLRIKRKKPY